MMNIRLLCLGLCSYLVRINCGKLDKIKGKINTNLIQLGPNINTKLAGTAIVQNENNTLRVHKSKPIRYTADELFQLKSKVDHNAQYKILNGKMCIDIRTLRLNRRPIRRGKHKAKVEDKIRLVDFTNLKVIKVMDSLGKINVNRRLSLSLCNAQSIKAKEEIVAEVLEDTESDIMVVREMWLMDNDKVWIDSTELLRPSYRMLTANRKGKMGGGIALICKSTLKTKHIRVGTKQSFEYSIWSIQTTNQAICLVAIYRPLDLSLPWFLDDFTEFMVDIIADSSNIVVMGDFNIHVNCDDDPNAVIFSDT